MNPNNQHIKTINIDSWRWLLARLAGMILALRNTLSRLAYESGSWVPIVLMSLALISVRLLDLPAQQEDFTSPDYVQKYVDARGIDSVKAVKEIGIIKLALPIITILGAPIMVGVNIVIISIILYLVGKNIYNSKTAFIPFFKMVAWATFIGAIQLGLTFIVKLINLDWSLPTNLAFFLSPEMIGSYFHSILLYLDLFLIWKIYLLGVGLSVLSSMNLQSAIGAVGTMYVIIIAVNSLLVAFSPS